MKQKALIVLIGILVIAYGGMSGCGKKKLQSDNNNASSGYDMPNISGSSTSVDTTDGSQGSGNAGGLWHGCKYTQGGVIISCSEMANITSPSSCQAGVYVDSCPTINLVAKCTIRDSYMTLIKINYEYSGTLQDAQQYTILQSGETVSCISG